MAKLVNMFIVLIAIQACLILYQTPMTTTGGGNIWEFVTSLDNWSSITFLISLIGFAGLAVGVGIVAGVFGYKSDFLIWAGAIAGFISLGSIFINLANVLRDDLIARVFVGPTCTIESCAPVTYFVGITIGVVAFFYVWTVIEWWRGNVGA